MMPKATLRQVSDAIAAILTDLVPEIPWQVSIMGPSYPKTTTGFICCDEVKYEAFAKDESEAMAEFSLTILSPNPKSDPTNTTIIEDYAMKVRDVLTKESKLYGWALDSSVESITFGTPAGISAIGVAVMKFLVKF